MASTIVAPAVEQSESAVILDRLTAYRSDPQKESPRKESPSVVEIPTVSVTHANNPAVSLAAVIEMPKPAIEEIAQVELAEYQVFVKEARMSRMNLRAKRQEIVAKLSAGRRNRGRTIRGRIAHCEAWHEILRASHGASMSASNKKEVEQNPNRPKDRVHRKKAKPPARVINMKLDLDLVDAIEQMGEDLCYRFHNTIDIALRWAVWAHSCGRSPYDEMMSQPGGFTAWDAKIRARRMGDVKSRMVN